MCIEVEVNATGKYSLPCDNYTLFLFYIAFHSFYNLRDYSSFINV